MNTEEFWTQFASGVYGLVELIRNWKPRQAEAREEPWVQRKVTG